MRVNYCVTRPDDFVRFGVDLIDGARPIGWTAWAGRRAVAIGGVVVKPDGEAWGHFGATDDYRGEVLRGLHRRTLKLLRRLERAGVRTIRTMCDPSIDRAQGWLTRLRFDRCDEAIDGDPIFIRKAIL